MILRALYDYYHRCGNLPQNGLANEKISYLVVIDNDGNFKRFVPLSTNDKPWKKFLVVKGVDRTSGDPEPNLFWDNVKYVLDHTEQSDAFVKNVNDVASQFPEEIEFRAVSLFYERGGVDLVRQDDKWSDVDKAQKKNQIVNVSFRIEGKDQIVAENPTLHRLIKVQNEGTGVCLITGKRGGLVRLTTRTPIRGGNAKGKLVAFNEDKGFDSFGKKQCLNAPISYEAEEAYTTALNHLLDDDSRNKFMLGDKSNTRTFVFWASGTNEACQKMEESLFDLLWFSGDDDKDDPNAKIEEVRKVFNAINSGKLKAELDDRFYILGLAPAMTRIAVVYWSETSLHDFAKKINRHFCDMEIVDPRENRWPYYGLWAMIKTVTLNGDRENITPNLPEAVAKSIFEGLPYPQTLYMACLRRIRAESAKTKEVKAKKAKEEDTKTKKNKGTGSVYPGRAAIIKAYLNRLNDNKNEKITVMLDKENQNQGYLCGRLFAVLDKIQEDTYHINSIRERYMNSASTTPAAVFATILNLSMHHSEKLDKAWLKVKYEKIKQEIIAKLPADGFPAHLDLQDQGRFFVGYYHQKQDLYTSKEDKAEE